MYVVRIIFWQIQAEVYTTAVQLFSVCFHQWRQRLFHFRRNDEAIARENVNSYWHMEFFSTVT